MSQTMGTARVVLLLLCANCSDNVFGEMPHLPPPGSMAVELGANATALLEAKNSDGLHDACGGAPQFGHRLCDSLSTNREEQNEHVSRCNQAGAGAPRLGSTGALA